MPRRAELLDARRLFLDAERHFARAAELRPDMPQPRAGQGLLSMRVGKEKEAREQLQKAFEGDRFNVRVANSLKVLRHLDRYKTLETDHFLVHYDPKTDALLNRATAPHSSLGSAAVSPSSAAI